MTVPPPRVDPIQATHDDIASMRVRGASKIGKHAALALARRARTLPARTVAEFERRLVADARRLASARPTAVTLRNALNRTLAAVPGSRDVADARRRVGAAARAHVRRIENAHEAIAVLASKFFRRGEVVLTHCHSTAAGAAIAAAARRGRVARAFATETRPFGQGFIQAPELAKAGVDVTLIVDSAVAHILDSEKVSLAVVGADAVVADGTLYNKIGTRQVAELANRFKIPFLVCAESDKFSPYTVQGGAIDIEERAASEITNGARLPGVKVRNPVFDATPPKLITRFFTEKGALAPREVRAFIRREFQGVRLWV